MPADVTDVTVDHCELPMCTLIEASEVAEAERMILADLAAVVEQSFHVFAAEMTAAGTVEEHPHLDALPCPIDEQIGHAARHFSFLAEKCLDVDRRSRRFNICEEAREILPVLH